jgi:hypothetical protein
MTRRNQVIVQFLLPVGAFFALAATAGAQTSGPGPNFDIAGIRLDVSVEQAKMALHAHDSSLKVQELQSQAQLSRVRSRVQWLEPRARNTVQPVKVMEFSFTLPRRRAIKLTRFNVNNL